MVGDRHTDGHTDGQQSDVILVAFLPFEARNPKKPTHICFPINQYMINI